MTMLAFGIRYLNGFVAATDPDSRERVEWPPHPARVFMALAAAHFHTGADPAERAALSWLEGEVPVIRAPEAALRAIVEQFVPVNDKAIWKKDPAKPNQKPPPPLQSAPGIMRERQPRTFARAFLQNDIAYLAWPSAEPTQPARSALEKLCEKVTRIGHSSSLVQMWVANEDEVREPNWVPDEDRAVVHLRIPSPGTLTELERNYNREAVEMFADLQVAAEDDSGVKAQKATKKRLKEEFPDGAPTRLRPTISRYQGYAPPVPPADAAAASGTVFSPHLVVLTLELEDGSNRQLDLLSVLAVAQRWREAILTHSNGLPNRIRELLSGHNQDGTPLDGAHLAFLPLGFVGHEHADGRLLGMALTLPVDISHDDRRVTLRTIGNVRRLVLGRLGVWNIVTATTSQTWNLRPHVWTAHSDGATHWSTVTPVVFDRHPKADNKVQYQREVAAMITAACTRIGLPEPREVIVTSVSAHLGVPPAFAFPRLRRKDGSERRHAHAILVFEQAVCGPVLVGAGRFRGYGVCRPLSLDNSAES